MSLYVPEKFHYSYTPLKLMTFTAYIITRERVKVHNANKLSPVLFTYTSNNQPYLTVISKNKIYFHQKQMFRKAKDSFSLYTPCRYMRKWRFGSQFPLIKW